MAGDLPHGDAAGEYIASLIANPVKVATRKASEMALAQINPRLPDTIGGSADLTGSNNTLAGGIGTAEGCASASAGRAIAAAARRGVRMRVGRAMIRLLKLGTVGAP